jgi:hypothetical protein
MFAFGEVGTEWAEWAEDPVFKDCFDGFARHQFSLAGAAAFS